VSKVVLVGGSELARVVLSLLADAPDLEPVACSVDAEHLDAAAEIGLPVVDLNALADSLPPADHELLVCVGYRKVNKAREELTGRMLAAGYRLATLRHPAAWISHDARVGAGCIVFPRAVVEPYASIGNSSILWSGSLVAHDSRIGAFGFLAPNATVAGNVTLGERAFIGANATVRDGVTVGGDCVVGAGAIVKHDLRDGTVLPAAQTPAGQRLSSDYESL
jgi:sugar O-acyltransferase (sialic acid O-acetyltransferase NeuD family)